jgi:hypothetical protein
MKQQHTPGPWHHDEYGFISAGPKVIGEAFLYELNDDERDEYLPCEANARLMAAAPELLEFVEGVAEGLNTGGNPGYLEDAVEFLEERAQRIIAKIEGDE